MADTIDTVYAGQHFRNSVEARWAVFFDALKIKYEYKTAGFNLEGVEYRPDFWLPHVVPDLAADGWGLWVVISSLPMSEGVLAKSIALVEKTQHNALIFQGYPLPNKYTVLKISGVNCSPPEQRTGFVFFQDEETSIVDLEGPHGSSYPLALGMDLKAAYRIAHRTRFEQQKGTRPGKRP